MHAAHSFASVRRLLALLMLAPLGCGGGGGAAGDASASADAGDGLAASDAPPSGDAPATEDGSGDVGAASYGHATLRANVHVLTSAEAATVVSHGADAWVLSAPLAVTVGQILLLDMEAVHVTAMTTTSAGQLQLSVTPAEVEEVFSQISLGRDLDLTAADFTPDPTMAAPAGPRRSKHGAAPLALPAPASPRGPWMAPFNKSVTLPVESPPFSATLTFTVSGKVSYDFDDATGPHGAFDVTDGMTSTLKIAATGGKAVTLPEKQLGIIRIPVPFTLADATLQRLGIRIASIYIPISVGAEASASYAVGLELDGNASTSYAASYDRAGGLKGGTPTLTGSMTLAGDVSGLGPTAAVRVMDSFGVYLRARPQLLILNTVASVGGDLKGGLYADGQLSLFLAPPHYCMQLQPNLKGEAFAFFKAIGVPQKMTGTISGEVDVGAPHVEGDCHNDGGVDAGADGGLDASAGADAPVAGGGDAAPWSGNWPDATIGLRDGPYGGNCGDDHRYLLMPGAVVGGWADYVLDTKTGLVWHTGMERVTNDFEPCDISKQISGDQPYCCRVGPPTSVPYYPTCNWLGFQKVCTDQGMRLATKDELLDANKGAVLACLGNWRSWSAATAPNRAYYVNVTGLLIGGMEQVTNGTRSYWSVSDYVRCVK